MRLGLLVIVLLCATTVSAEPIVVSDGLWTDGTFSNLLNVEATADAGTLSIAFDYDWARHEIDDRHITVFGFQDATIMLTRSLRSWLPEEGLTSLSIGAFIFPPGMDVVLHGPDAAPSLAFEPAFINRTYQPGEGFTIGSDSIGALGEESWRAVIRFTGAIAADQSGIGHGDITVTRVPEPSTALLWVLGCLSVFGRRRQRPAPSNRTSQGGHA